MEAYSQQLRIILAILLDEQRNPSVARFFFLLALGDYGPGAHKWVGAFRDLQLIHLLVLSGSQVQQFRKIMGRLMAPLLVWLLPQMRPRRMCFHVLMVGVVLFYGFATRWPAPLNRALIFLLVGSFFPRWNASLLVVVSLMLHVFIFPSDIGSISFYLSWTAFLLLVMLGEKAGTYPMQCLIFLCMFLILCVFQKTQVRDLASLRFFWGFVLSGVFILIFDLILMPFAALLLCLAFVLAALPNLISIPISHVVAGILHPAMAGLKVLLLVALEPFRYT